MAIKYYDGEKWLDLASGERGPVGPTGNGISSIVMNADYSLTITMTNGQAWTSPPIKGEQGEQGNGIASAVMNADYTLTLTFDDGTSYTTPSLKGESGITVQTVTLASSGWTNKTQTVSASVTATDDVFISAAPASISAYTTAKVYCSGIGNGTLTFVCTDVPSADLTVNVGVIG